MNLPPELELQVWRCLVQHRWLQVHRELLQRVECSHPVYTWYWLRREGRQWSREKDNWNSTRIHSLLWGGWGKGLPRHRVGCRIWFRCLSLNAYLGYKNTGWCLPKGTCRYRDNTEIKRVDF